MLRLNLTFHDARTGRPHALGAVTITNDGTGTKARGHYTVRLVDAEGVVQAQARVAGYPRAQGAWRLVHLALQALDALDHALPTGEEPSTTARRGA
jgi:hypothetical protein